MTPRRTFGLQGWLVAALLAVGIVASLAVLLVVLPTLESSVRTDRAESERRDLVGKLDAAVAAQGLAFGADAEEIQALADRYQQELGGEVEVYYQPGVPFQDPIVVHSPQQAELVTSLPLPQGRFSGRFDDGRAVVAATPIAAASGEAVLMAVRRLEGVAPETAVVRRRVILAMIAVLGLACLAGVAIARVLGGRIRRLAGTAATLAGGDLAARAPRARVAPQELVTLGESLNGMAERLQSLVGQITAERDRDRAMVASLAEGVLAVAPDGAVTLANDAANRYLGLPEGAERLMLEGLPAPILDAVLAARRPDGGAVDRREISLPGGVELELHAARLSRDGRRRGGRDAARRHRGAPAGACPARPGGQRLPRAQDADRRPQGVPGAAGGGGRQRAPPPRVPRVDDPGDRPARAAGGGAAPARAPRRGRHPARDRGGRPDRARRRDRGPARARWPSGPGCPSARGWRGGARSWSWPTPRASSRSS